MNFLKQLSYDEQDQLDVIISNIIIERAQLPKLLQQFNLDKNLITAISNKKSRTAKEKILKAEVEKKNSLLLKQRHIDFLNQLEQKLSTIDENIYNKLLEETKGIHFDSILDDLEFAFNDSDFSKLFGKALVSQQKGINIKYHIEYLQSLHDFSMMPTMIDLYQLSVLYSK